MRKLTSEQARELVRKRKSANVGRHGGRYPKDHGKYLSAEGTCLCSGCLRRAAFQAEKIAQRAREIGKLNRAINKIRERVLKNAKDSVEPKCPDLDKRRKA